MMFADSLGQESKQGIRGRACLCSMLLGSQLEASKAGFWNHLKAHSFTKLEVGADCGSGASVPLHVSLSIVLFSQPNLGFFAA